MMFHNSAQRAALLTPLLWAALASTAAAADRTVCWQHAIQDTRFDCPSSGAGVRRACNPGAWVNPVGMRVQLWDKDSGGVGNDDYIGTWVTTGSGLVCATFAWEGASYQVGDNEANPDVYTVALNEVRNTAASDESIRLVQANGTVYPFPSGRDGWDGDANAGTAFNCLAGSNCNIASGNAVYLVSNAASDHAIGLMALDSAQHVLLVYTSRLDGLVIDLEYPTDDPICTTACAVSRTLLEIPSGLGTDGDRASHEMGHVLQMHEFNQDDLRDSLIGGGWSFGTRENESGATTEGWATYVGVNAWWDPGNSNSAPVYSSNIVEDPSGTGDAPQSATCTNNHDVPGMVARAFWDLDDARNEAAAGAATGPDESNLSSTSISAGWDNFADGTANRQDFENSIDGVNVEDYDFNFNVSNNTLKNHNCLQDQVD